MSLSKQFDCFLTALSSYGSWTSRQGEKFTYFDGTAGSKTCACGTASPNACSTHPLMGQPKCNCDLRDPEARSDSGVITNKVCNCYVDN